MLAHETAEFCARLSGLKLKSADPMLGLADTRKQHHFFPNRGDEFQLTRFDWSRFRVHIAALLKTVIIK